MKMFFLLFCPTFGLPIGAQETLWDLKQIKSKMEPEVELDNDIKGKGLIKRYLLGSQL